MRRVSENEVIAEFLKSDFMPRHSANTRKVCVTLLPIPISVIPVTMPSAAPCSYIRHRSLWKEIPQGTEWYEAEIGEEDTSRFRVFPRAQWRKLASGNFSITNVLEGMRTRGHLLEPLFLAKIASIARGAP